MVFAFQLYAGIAVAVSAGLLVLGLLQFWAAFEIGFQGHFVAPAVGNSSTNHAASFQIQAPTNKPVTIEVKDADESDSARFGNQEIVFRRKHCAKQALVFAIHGLEFGLLAPICFIIARSLSAYIAVKFAKAGMGNPLTRRKEVQDAGAILIGSKALVMGLLSSLIGVDIVSRVLETKNFAGPGLWIMLTALTVLGGYYIALEWLAHAHERRMAVNSPTAPAPATTPARSYDI